MKTTESLFYILIHATTGNRIFPTSLYRCSLRAWFASSISWFLVVAWSMDEDVEEGLCGLHLVLPPAVSVGREHDEGIDRGSLSDLISRLTRGIGITNEKLDLILIRIEEVEAEVEKGGRPSEIERKINEIVDDLNALESPINGFFDDVETLKQYNHPEANSFCKQVYGLHQRRQAYLERLTNQLLVRLGLITETMSKEQFEQNEALRASRFGRLEECIEWVRTQMERLVSMEFTESPEVLEEMFERHKGDSRDILDFRHEVDGCIASQAEISSEDSVEYYELLKILESEYQQLRDLSAERMLDLDSLIAFVRAAQQILNEMELREPEYNDVLNRGATLLNKGHPATQVIEVYIQTLKKQWDISQAKRSNLLQG